MRDVTFSFILNEMVIFKCVNSHNNKYKGDRGRVVKVQEGFLLGRSPLI